MADEIKLSGKEFQELKSIRLSLQDIATELRKMNRKDERYQEIWNEGYLAGIKSMQPQVYPNDYPYGTPITDITGRSVRVVNPNDYPYRTSTYYENLKRESEELKRKIQENLNNWDAELEVDPNSPERM